MTPSPLLVIRDTLCVVAFALGAFIALWVF